MEWNFPPDYTLLLRHCTCRVYSERCVRKRREVSQNTDQSIQPYDAIVTIFGEDKSGGNTHVWKTVVNEMRKLPSKSQSPFIVYVSKYNAVARRKFV